MQEPYVSQDINFNTRMPVSATQHDARKSIFAKRILFYHWRNYLSLQLIRQKLSKFPPEMITLIPASRWLFDNYHLLYRNLKAFQANGSISQFSKLPIIKSGPMKGYPRIYLVAREMIICSNKHLNEETVIKLICEYQSTRVLTNDELNLLPEMISFALLEKIIEEAKKIIPSIRNKSKAERIINKILPHIISDDQQVFSRLKNYVQKGDLLEHSFSSHLIYRLKSLSVNQHEIQNFVSQVLGTTANNDNISIEKITERELLFEAQSENSMSSYISSLDEISSTDKDRLLTNISHLEAILAKDPGNVYSKMDKASRARYRNAVSKISKTYRVSEIDIANHLVKLAKSPPQNIDLPAPDHVGTYIIGPGLYLLRASISGSPSKKHDLLSRFKLLRQLMYFIVITALSILLYFIMYHIIQADKSKSLISMILFYFSISIPLIGLSVSIINNIYTSLITPKAPLSMDFEKGIPSDCKTFIVIPTILSSPESVKDTAKQLEQHYLVNRMQNLYFALLVDFKDAKEKTLPEDEQIINCAINEISQLNTRYPEKPYVFFLFYRNREYNPQENCWMGWERKRGKLECFNTLLKGEDNSDFIMPVGDPSIFPEIKYVITLDSDTELTNGSAIEMIGAMEHPLNQPVLYPDEKKIKYGYAIIQSEVRNRAPTSTSGISQHIFANESGFDPYSTIVSDVYQDTFDEGIYAGKGIYNLEIFHKLLHNKIPVNHVLSHDLLEASFTRCAFTSGIKLMNSAPSSVAAYIKREHRWVRGDWQLLSYIFGNSEINFLSRWKMLDNLRRSLSPTFQIFLIFTSIFLIPAGKWIWLFFVFFEPIIQLFMLISGVISQKIRHPFRRLSIPVFYNNLKNIIIQTIFFFVILPTRALNNLDAITRTIYRLIFSRRNLLEWQTADSIEKTEKNTPKRYFMLMLPSYILSAALLIRVFFPLNILLKILFIIFSILWLLSPFITYYASKKKINPDKTKFSNDDRVFLRKYASKIWCYFTDFAGEDTHWLSPDHYQEIPGPKAENKTSPTNIGMQLIATLTAKDLGFIGLFNFVETCERVLFTIDQMSKWNGHLYNWYDTKSLKTLEPKYISTVDSGNFFAHLLTLKNGILEIIECPVYSDELVKGVIDMQNLDLEENASASIIPIKTRREKAGILFKNSTQNDKHSDLASSIQTTNSSYLDNQRKENASDGGLDKNFKQVMWFIDHVEELVKNPDTKKRTIGLCSDILNDKNNLELSCSKDFLTSLRQLAEDGNEMAANLITRLENMVFKIDDFIKKVSFLPLYDNKKQLFRIGYNDSSKLLDRGHYNLMASEARLSSFLAIAKGDIPKKHWAALGKPLTILNGLPGLVSWSGSMFEYLMPNIVMKTPNHSIMDYSCKACVLAQIKYGRKMHFPWGISESQYYVFDNYSNYQYGPFGIVHMRLQSTLKPVKVVAPYATFLALDIYPYKAITNLKKLEKIGAIGKYGLYESLDFNSPDPNKQRKFNLVKSFMAHHLGMSMASINNALNNDILKDRFHKDAMIRASESILEDIFKSNLVTIASKGYTIDVAGKDATIGQAEGRVFTSINTPYPVGHILSNGHYQLLVTTTGDGFSSYNNLMINRWKNSYNDGGSGLFIYIKNLESGHMWSNTYNPTQVIPDSYKVIFSHDKVEFKRTDGQFTTNTEITVSPSDSLEIRRVSITNNSDKPRTIELTSYIEISENEYLADLSHPAYSKLFIETKYDADRKILLAKRRSKKPTESYGYIMHQVQTESRLTRPINFETDRKSFIGRGGSLYSPESLTSNIPLSESYGSSTDPILSLQVMVVVSPGRSVTVNFITAYCDTIADVYRTSDKFAIRYSDDDVFKMSRTSSLLELEYLKMQPAKLNAIQDIVASLFYPTNAFKDIGENIADNCLGQSGLWKFGISGDLPVMLLRISKTSDIETLRDVLFAYEFLRLQKVSCNLVILNEHETSYDDQLMQLIYEQTSTIRVFDEARNKSGIFILKSSQITPQERLLLFTVARIVFSSKSGIYFTKVKNSWPKEIKTTAIPLSAGAFSQIPKSDDYSHINDPVPEFFNGIGGFVSDGREYEMRLLKKIKTPAPWINVIANDSFGFLVSETGGGYTWALNSRENKLTPWCNDPILDPISETIYVKSHQNGSLTSPFSMKAGTEGPFYVKHGFGYSVFERRDMDIYKSATVFVSLEDSIKLTILKLKNLTDIEQEFSITYFVKWVLGDFHELTNHYVATFTDENKKVLMARNLYTDKNKDGIAFIFSSETITSFTGDQKKFFGTNGTARYPLELENNNLSNTVGAELEACGAIQTKIILSPFSEYEIVFGLGYKNSQSDVLSAAVYYGDIINATAQLNSVRQYWSRLPGDIQVKTPDRAMDIMMNGWLLYQVIACRIRARCAYYQCGGAYGFRDQLQDVLSLVSFDSNIARRHILKCCSKQFVEGDVLHWWHDNDGVGVRTKISDNLLWLPYVTSEYCEQTGDYDLFDENVNFIEGKVLEKNQHEVVYIPNNSSKSASVYSHCLLAIDYASKFGEHGLPLIRGGDWNDGMNMVGPLEQGESVWLGWFLLTILDKFIPLCEMKGDDERAKNYRMQSQLLKENLDKYAWDGQWYLRAFYDNGQTIGSSKNEDCRIDSISQSWAVLSGKADTKKSIMAMESVKKYLIKPEDGIVLLLTPPFDKDKNNPGYIKGYNPGIRENGGQYTHAAVWTAMAFCQLNDGNEAYKILNMINPIQSTQDLKSLSHYEREPYVLSADVSYGFPNTGKGGWSWYTGAAGWMYRTILQSFLGIKKKGNILSFEPCIPANYRRYQVEFQYGLSVYEISILNDYCNGCEVSSLSIDGKHTDSNTIELISDGLVHHVEIRLGNQ